MPQQMPRSWKWPLLVAVRLCLSVLSRSFFVPDEYFQSLEPAHRLVFGYGHLTWEWVSSKPIRSFIYPLLYVPIYGTLKFLSLDSSTALVRTVFRGSMIDRADPPS